MLTIPVVRAVVTFLLACALGVSASRAADIRFDGVLGNSGEQGPALVRFDGGPAPGVGVVVDRFGSLWDRGGDARLNRYAVDGRLIASYPLPKSRGDDQISIAGDTVVLLIGGKVYVLDLDAPAGTPPKPLKASAKVLSSGSVDGAVAVATKGDVQWLDVATGSLRPAVTVDQDVRDLAVTPDGALFVSAGGKLRKFVDGAEVTDGWPRPSPGERAQFVDGHWFGHAWHGTLRRFDASAEPDPGVVLGGASGSFIGHLDANTELENGRGLAKVAPGLYAISGLSGVMHLINWDEGRRQMQIVRRIGPVSALPALALDRAGNVWTGRGRWRWADGPDAPLTEGVKTAANLALAILDTDDIAAFSLQGDAANVYSGPLDAEVKGGRLDKKVALPKDPVAAVAFKIKNRQAVLVANKTGAARAVYVGPNGSFQSDAGDVALTFATPVSDLTTLAMKGPETLLAGADGHVIELSRWGDGAWQETRRWSDWPGAGDGAPADRFGDAIHLASDAGRLWVADATRHRVTCFDLATGKPLASFGTADAAGDDLRHLAGPTEIAARGDRAVVFDEGNQRLVKFTLVP